jgi:hypothetical protein
MHELKINLITFKIVVNCVQWMINELRHLVISINHPPNVINHLIVFPFCVNSFFSTLQSYVWILLCYCWHFRFMVAYYYEFLVFEFLWFSLGQRVYFEIYISFMHEEIFACCWWFFNGFQRSDGGLFIDLYTFLAFGKDYVGWNYEKTGNPIYLHIKQTKKLVLEDRPSKKPTLLAIGMWIGSFLEHIVTTCLA